MHGPKVRARVAWLIPVLQGHRQFSETNFKILMISSYLERNQWACVEAEPWREEDALFGTLSTRAARLLCNGSSLLLLFFYL